jgi:transcriptional regulator with PAS, ATPase and Fis domain
LSRRGTHRFQAVNCAALPDTLFESEIFGYEKGAFTGAHDRKPGRLELANNGTLFLDEIGDLALVGQAKLLRALEERRFERLGGNEPIEVNFRLISATNRPLDQFVRDSRFREDLYYRVNAFAIRLPSLRERQVDIPVLAQRFLARYCAAQGMPLDSKSFSREALDLLIGYPWPGNIRELENEIERMLVLAGDAPELTASMVSPRVAGGAHSVARALRDVIATAEADAIVAALGRHIGVRALAAADLGVSEPYLAARMAALGLDQRGDEHDPDRPD